MKNKTTAWILAILLWTIGWHKFYLWKPWQWLLYLLFSSSWIPSLLGICEWIVYICNNKSWFDYHYNGEELKRLEKEAEDKEMKQLHKTFLYQSLNRWNWDWTKSWNKD